jgi:pyrroloquinoline quinone (PQQ) biosynthesis protein C
LKNYSFKDFKSDYDHHVGQFSQAIIDFPWENETAYALWCAQTFYYVSYSTRLLALSAANCSLEQNSFHRRFIDHLGEEKGHERLSINDLKAIGRTIDSLPELPETAIFYQNQYFWILQRSPLSFFGYVLALEGMAVQAGGNLYQRAVKTYGPKASSFLKVHSEEDISHLETALNQVKEMSGEDLYHIAQNMIQSCLLYTATLAHIVQITKAEESVRLAA